MRAPSRAEAQGVQLDDRLRADAKRRWADRRPAGAGGRRIAFLNFLVLTNLPAHTLFLLLFAAYLPATWPILIVGMFHVACFSFTLF
jgi:hypothetical protein